MVEKLILLRHGTWDNDRELYIRVLSSTRCRISFELGNDELVGAPCLEIQH